MAVYQEMGEQLAPNWKTIFVKPIVGSETATKEKIAFISKIAFMIHEQKIKYHMQFLKDFAMTQNSPVDDTKFKMFILAPKATTAQI